MKPRKISALVTYAIVTASAYDILPDGLDKLVQYREFISASQASLRAYLTDAAKKEKEDWNERLS